MNTTHIPKLLAAALLGALALLVAPAHAQDSQKCNDNNRDEPTNLKLQATPGAEVATKADEIGGGADLAKKLSNPVADLISVLIQMNFNFGGGSDIPEGRSLLRRLPGPVARFANRLSGEDRDQAFRFLMNVQPVIPISLSEDWNVISRTIVPVVCQDDFLVTTSQGGMGDTTQSFFPSPKKTDPFIWGAGPVFLLPTATDHNTLGAYRWGMGPTGVILKQTGPWTYGALANHIWSFARDDGRKEINSTYLQPFIATRLRPPRRFRPMPSPPTIGSKISGQCRCSPAWAKSSRSASFRYSSLSVFSIGWKCRTLHLTAA